MRQVRCLPVALDDPDEDGHLELPAWNPGPAPSPTAQMSPENTRAYRRAAKQAVRLVGGGLLVPKDSLYGSVIVLPQVARTLGNHPTFVGKALVAWVCLALVLGMQGAFVYEVYKMVATKDMCCTENPESCREEGFIEGGLAMWGVLGGDRHRWYLCYPNVNPSQRSQVLRKLCVVAFVICLFKDLRQSYELAMLLWELPNETGTWLVISPQKEEVLRVNLEGHKKLVTETDNRILWQVDGLELYWKLIIFGLVLLPKLIIFGVLYFYGSMWLLSVADHQELITNAVALVFVLDLDEAVFCAVTTSDVQQQMDNLQPWNPQQLTEPKAQCEAPSEDLSDDLSERSLSSESDEDGHWSLLGRAHFTCGKCCSTCLRVLTFPVLLTVASVSVINWYDYHCWASGEMNQEAQTPFNYCKGI